MIEFVTLLVGLVAGPQVVDLSVGGGVAEVRLLLDGEPIAGDESAPWQLEFDLGTSLHPRLLEAVALDDVGQEVGRAVQHLNVPRPPAEVRIALERGKDGTARTALLTWESSIRSYPRATRAWFDGEELDTSDPRRIALPAHDEKNLHLLQVELEFTSDVIAQAQTVIGGLYLDQAQVDLTAFPVLARGKTKKAKPIEMAGWFSVGVPGSEATEQAAVRVVGYEKGGLDLVLVRGPGVGQSVLQLEGTFSQGLSSGGAASGAASPGIEGSGPGVMSSVANVGAASNAERLQRIMALDKGQRLRILAPRARTQAGQTVAMEVFALSPEITREQGGLYWALQQTVVLPGLSPSLRLADAVAVAGLQAANGHRRRSVLLVLSETGSDESRHSASTVRAYLASIQVPLYVWRIGDEAGDHWEEWGPGENVSDFRNLQNAARRLAGSLDRQRIVWLEGLHLPNAIRTTEQAKIEAVR